MCPPKEIWDDWLKRKGKPELEFHILSQIQMLIALAMKQAPNTTDYWTTVSERFSTLGDLGFLQFSFCRLDYTCRI